MWVFPHYSKASLFWIGCWAIELILCRNAGTAHTLLHKRNELVQEYGRGTHVTAQAQSTCAGIRARRTRYCTSATNLCRNTGEARTLLHKRTELVQEY